MNIALQNGEGSEFYIAAVKRHANEDVYVASGKRVSKVGTLLAMGQAFTCADRQEAERKVRGLIKIKIKRRRWLRVELEDLPASVVKFLEVPPEMQITPEELILILRKVQDERYVIFFDVAGLEEYFDAGVEYLGYLSDDEDILKVFDRFGALRDCFTRRMKSIERTERALEATLGRDAQA